MQNQQMFHSPLCTQWKSGKILSQHLTQFYQSWHWDMFPAFLHFSFTTISWFWLLAQNTFTSFAECWFVNKAKIFLNTTVYSFCNTLRLLDANPKKMKMTKMKYFVVKHHDEHQLWSYPLSPEMKNVSLQSILRNRRTLFLEQISVFADIVLRVGAVGSRQISCFHQDVGIFHMDICRKKIEWKYPPNVDTNSVCKEKMEEKF